ncbi:hypothetical protein CAPTEDRAFT_110364 [Capitella teleta]|uniref:Glucuronosyltransferase n=1 Tax=Capitella teleta TaxID=283909 RepID=R7TNZ8_CAPTE|nr:hypothetical protein CAPTEDRAFT_110364 [Capitella teleta]|eukprot:ELT95354.1 hypothetical protein CAPTEDRAFT_110364 [Capitella teleta]
MLYSSEVENEITDSVFRHKTPDYIGATVSEFAFHGCEVMMRDQPLLDQLRMIHFDLAIIDAFPLAPCASIVPHHLGIPFITKDASPLAVHQPLFPAFIPHSNLHLSHKMYFWERVENAIVLLMELYGLASPSINDLTLLKKFSPCLVDWNELLRLALLHISTTDHHLSYPTPVLANHVQLPGVTWRNTRPLNNPIFRFMDLAPEGAVVVSFGSSVHSLPPRYLKTLFSAFQNFSGLVFYLKLDQQIIHSVDVPRNVLPLSWLPLNDLLGHPRTKLFISHCGRSVLHESVFHGVPVMCIPLFKEDEINTQNVVYLGLGKHVDIFTASAKTLKDTTSELLRNEMYQKNVKRISLMLKSHKFNPTETVAFWVEHVLKFGGSHLRSEAMNMTSAQFAMLDIALAFFVLFSCLFCEMYRFCSVCWCRCYRTKGIATFTTKRDGMNALYSSGRKDSNC